MPSITSRSKEARKFLQEYEAAEKISQTIYWHRAKYTYLLKKDNLWKFAVGEGAGTWAAFCAEMLHCPAVSADHRVANYEFYVIKHGYEMEKLGEYDSYALYYIALYNKESDQETVSLRMEDSKVLGRKDLIANLKGEDCNHPTTHKEVDEIEVCDVCTKKLQHHVQKKD